MTDFELKVMRKRRQDLIELAELLVHKMAEAEANGLHVEAPRFAREELRLMNDRPPMGRLPNITCSGFSLKQFDITIKFTKDDRLPE